MSSDLDAQRAAEAADQWLRSGKPAPQPIPIGRQAGALRHAQQQTTFSLLQRIDDLKAEVRWERERADRLEVELVLAQRALQLQRVAQSYEAQFHAALVVLAVLIVIAAWAFLFQVTP